MSDKLNPPTGPVYGAWIPDSAFGQFFWFGVAEFVSSFIVCCNMRALARASYFWSGLTDAFLYAQGFLLYKMAMEDKRARSWYVGLGEVIGGTLGSLLSIYLTTHLFGG